jgi:hypothetical protein
MNPVLITLYLYKVNFVIILPYTCTSASASSRFLYSFLLRRSYAFVFPTMSATYSSSLIFLGLVTYQTLPAIKLQAYSCSNKPESLKIKIQAGVWATYSAKRKQQLSNVHAKVEKHNDYNVKGLESLFMSLLLTLTTRHSLLQCNGSRSHESRRIKTFLEKTRR